MKIFICSSKHFYDQVTDIANELKKSGHQITLPNSFDNPGREEEYRQKGGTEHATWKGGMLREQEEKVKNNDAIIVLNFEKDGQPNYIGGSTFLEMFKAWELDKKVFLYHPIPQGMLFDEICAFHPVILNGDLSLVK